MVTLFLALQVLSAGVVRLSHQLFVWFVRVRVALLAVTDDALSLIFATSDQDDAELLVESLRAFSLT